MYNAVVIGGGVVGVSILRELSLHTNKVVLVEKEAELSFGVSKSNSGIIHTGFQSEHTTLKAKLAVRGNELYRKLAAELNFPLEERGELVVAYNADEKEFLKKIKLNGERLGIEDLKIVGREWLNQNEPNLSSSIKWALLGPSACVINPYEAVYAMSEDATKNGAKILINHEVTTISYKKDHWIIKAGNKELKARNVINAAGLYADKIAKLAKIDTEEISPRKGQEFLLDKHVVCVSSRIIFPVPDKVSKGVLLIPTVDGNTMIGPTAENVEDKEDLTTDAAGKKHVLEHIRKTAPCIQETDIIASFAGLRATTSSGDFYINEDKPGFINLIGIQSPGLTAAPAIAQLVLDIIISSFPSLSVERGLGGEFRNAIPKVRTLSHEERDKLIKKDSDYGEIICRCEIITKGEIKEAIRRGARTLDGIKFRTRSQMGRCHGAFCTMKIIDIMAKELGVKPSKITKRGKGSELIVKEK